MGKKNAAEGITIGATAIETKGQREGLGRVIDGIANSPSFRGNIAKLQNEKIGQLRAQARDAHFAAYDEWCELRKKDSYTPDEADRRAVLRERFGKKLRPMPGKYVEGSDSQIAYGVPSSGDVHVDKLLTNIMIDSPQGEFIADLVLPPLTVDKRSDTIAQQDRAQYLTDAWDDTRAEGEPTKMGSFAYGSTVSYTVLNHSFGFPVPDETTQNQDAPYNVSRDVMRAAEEIVRLKREVRTRTLVTTAANYPAAHRLSTSTKWDNSDVTNIEPLTDIHTAHNLIRKAIGKFPNSVLLNFPMVQALIKLDDYRDRFKYVKEITDSVLIQQLASYFSVENVYVGMAMRNSAAPGATASYEDVWPDDCVVFRQEPFSLFYGGLGVTFCTDPGTVTRWRDPDPSARTDKAAFEMDCVEKILQSSAGVHIDDTLT